MNTHTPMPHKSNVVAFTSSHVPPQTPLHRREIDPSYSSFGSSFLLGIFALALMGWISLEVALPALDAAIESAKDYFMFHFLSFAL